MVKFLTSCSTRVTRVRVGVPPTAINNHRSTINSRRLPRKRGKEKVNKKQTHQRSSIFQQRSGVQQLCPPCLIRVHLRNPRLKTWGVLIREIRVPKSPHPPSPPRSGTSDAREAPEGIRSGEGP